MPCQLPQIVEGDHQEDAVAVGGPLLGSLFLLSFSMLRRLGQLVLRPMIEGVRQKKRQALTGNRFRSIVPRIRLRENQYAECFTHGKIINGVADTN
jgi:hypothetical protein